MIEDAPVEDHQLFTAESDTPFPPTDITMFGDWNSDLTPILGQISRVATGHGALRVIPGGARMALALPVDRRAALVVAELYQPQRLKGKIFLELVKAAIASGLVKSIPPRQLPVTAPPKVDWLKQAAASGTVGFIGCNPNHGPRCVLAGIDPISGEKFVAKLGFGRSAAAVRREAGVLNKLSGKFRGIVSSIGLDEESTTQGPLESSIECTITAHSSSITDAGCEWALLRLPHLGNDSPVSMTDNHIKCLLEQWLGSECHPLGTRPYSASLIDKVPLDGAPAGWHNRMRALPIRSALLHGDFAVWNLRYSVSSLVAIDWEWGREDAVAGVDLAHGLRQECYMARGMKPDQAVAWILAQAASPTWRNYLEVSGWGNATDDWLRLGLLHSHFNALNPSEDLLGVLGIHLN